MISRSTLYALIFACLATLLLAGAAKAQRTAAAAAARPAAIAVYQLPRVVVTGRSVRPSGQAQAGN